MASQAKDLHINNPPLDGISCLKFSPVHDNHLLVGSWDATLRLYDTERNEEKSKFDHKAAVLSAAFSTDGRTAYSGGLDTWVRAFDLETDRETVLGQHEQTISSVVFSRDANLLATASWDCTLKSFDPRSPTSALPTQTLPEKIYSMDIVGTTIVVAMAARKFHIYDIRQMEKPKQERESSLRFMTRAVACMPNGEGYATSSIEGRIAVEYFDPSPEIQQKKYAFKCHRQVIDEQDYVYPVNALDFHPVYNTFASAGSDGTVSIWDHTAKKRLRQYPKYPTAISALAFNRSGAKLAIGVSYAWDQGEEGSRAQGTDVVQVVVRDVGDECKPKAKA